jgi:hypothetical protein
MRRTGEGWGVLVVLVVLTTAACGTDPAREVVPMVPPLGPPAPLGTVTEIIPPEEVRKSQAAAVSQRVANTEITVTYSRPVARGRELFGGIVPYGRVWNPGADQATAVTFSRDVTINGQPLVAGKYSIWAIPDPDRWTLIFSRAGDVFHTPYPGEEQDALRLEITPETATHAEAMTFDFPIVEGKEAILRFRWGNTSVPMTIVVP